MALTKKDRDALPADHFAVPEKRVLPIHDSIHARMAWEQIDRTNGLSVEDRKAARGRILARAKELDMKTDGWTIRSISFAAMSLEMPTAIHPNKSPFSGILVRLDEPSDGSPHGAMGCKIILTEKAAAAALPSLLGMAVNFQGKDLSGHDPKSKIGIIDAATIERDSQGPYVQISGFFYASDFDTVVTQIKAEQKALGFSFEAEDIFLSDADTDPLVIEGLTFTGAAVLKKNKAAYQTTKIAAHTDDQNQGDINVTEAEKILAAIEALGTRLAKVESGETQRLQAASVADKVQKHSDAIHKVADAMHASGIGMHPTRGHVAVLRHMADSMMSEACDGKIASAYSGPSMYSSNATTETHTPDPAIAELKASIASLTTQVKDAMAAASKTIESPARKTITPEITRLLAKANLSEPENGEPFTIAKVDEALKSIPDPQARMQIKAGLRNAGLLKAA